MIFGTILTSALAFIVAIGILVTIHEFGHFWVARRCGVKVLRFSVGFGKPLWIKTGKDGTEYAISAIPLGGYVKMLGEGQGDAIPADQLDQAFNRKSVWARIAIVAAGPVFNFLFAIVAYWVLFATGVPGLRTEIGQVIPDTPAARAGVQVGDEIRAVQGEAVNIWQVANLKLIDSALSGETVVLQLEQAGQLRQVSLDLQNISPEPNTLLAEIGIAPWRPTIPAVIGQVVEDSAAARAGFQVGDELTAVDGIPLTDWQQWVGYVQAHPGEVIQIDAVRQGAAMPLSLLPEQRKTGDKIMGFAGVAPAITDDIRQQYQARETLMQAGPLVAMWRGAERTWEMSIVTLKSMWKMLTGAISWRHIGGPLQIAEYAGYSASNGLNSFLNFLAVISISLGVLNLLPVPVLDGGHLLYYVVEIIKGSPLSESAQLLGQKIGIALVMMLMSLAFYNDITRLL